jgi:hypothetical protein
VTGRLSAEASVAAPSQPDFLMGVSSDQLSPPDIPIGTSYRYFGLNIERPPSPAG